MINAIVTIFLVFAPAQATSDVTDAQKSQFLELVKRLPHEGEFYTEEGIKKAAPYLPILFALTEKDIGNLDIYPFIALSRGLCDQTDQRNYALRNFGQIRHPTLKLGWAVMLFDAGSASDEIIRFLRVAVGNETQAKSLSAMLGPKYEDFKRRLVSQPSSKR